MNTPFRVVILGGGTAGWMTASYLQKAFEGAVQITLLEAATIPRIGVGEATIPNLQRVFFDRLGIPEKEWMREVNASFKMAVKFVNWHPREAGPDRHFYHAFGLIPNIDNIPLSHYWVHRQRTTGNTEAVDYACYREPPMMDAKLSPCYRDGQQATWYAWHFDANLVAAFLKKKAVGWGVTHVVDEFDHADLDERGFVKALNTKSGKKLEGDLFVDCSGFRGLLINKTMNEPFIDMSDHLLCNSAVASQVPHDDEKHGIEPYTSSIGMSSGWTWKIPMLGRFGSGYVYSSHFQTEQSAADEFCKLWGLDPAKQELNRVKFRVGRNRNAWVKNVVGIGLASCFVEPLESSGIYFIYAGIYQLAKHFPDRNFDPVLATHFNREIEFMFDDTRDFIQAHYLSAPRNDTKFWAANKHDLKLSSNILAKLETYDAGLTVNMPVADENSYYSNFESEFHNFWTNSSYYCILAGMGRVPQKPLPTLGLRPSALRGAEAAFAKVKREQQDMLQKLPSCHEYLKRLHHKDGMALDPILNVNAQRR